MSIQLSHTKKELYLKSPRAFYLHYHLNLREKILGSPLFFGSLIETGLNSLFQGATLEQSLQTFRRSFKTYRVNGNTVNLNDSSVIRYNKSDVDLTVFSESELKDLENKTDQFKAWASLERKGEMLIQAYHKDIMPNIKKVVSIQPEKVITNPDGDEIIVKGDLICEWIDGRLIIPDHKTSSQSATEVAKNEGYNKQIALYYEAFKEDYPLDASGFIVLEKKIRKNDPRARVEAKILVPTEEIIEKSLDEFDKVLYGIKSAEFPCLSPRCDVYGSECCYKKYCATGGKDMTGLVKVGKYK